MDQQHNQHLFLYQQQAEQQQQHAEQQQQHAEQQQQHAEQQQQQLTAAAVADNDNATSDYSSNSSSGFTSIDQERTHVFEHGRRYQCFIEGRYPLPNDELEQDREEFKHHLGKGLLDGKLFLSPIGDHPQKIADMGCGAGLWAIEIGDMFPSARVIGVDLSNIQPRWVPPNVEFRMDDLESEWIDLYSDLDMVFMRSVLPTLRNPGGALGSAYRSLRSGGWLECHELCLPRGDSQIQPDHPLNAFTSILRTAFGSIWGWDIDLPHRLPDLIEAAGFTNLHVVRSELPIGGWGADERLRERGLITQTIILDLAHNCLVQRDAIGLSRDEAESLLRDLGAALAENRGRPTAWWFTICAQKPES